MSFQPIIYVSKSKRGKIRKVSHETLALQEEITKYTQGMAAFDFLFPSRQGNKPISRVMAWKIIKESGRAVGVKKV